jgi:RecA/RadA recombinase
MNAAEAKKLELLVNIRGYKFHDGGTPDEKIVNLGGGYQLHCKVSVQADQWRITKDDDAAINYVFNADAVPIAFRSNGEKLVSNFKEVIKENAGVLMGLMDQEINPEEEAGLEGWEVEDAKPNKEVPEEKARLEREENERKLAAMETYNTAKDSMSKVSSVPEQKKHEPELPESSNLLDMIYKYVGYDVLEVFGDTGSGKSKFALTVAQEAVKANKKVFYLDTERNLSESDIKGLKGCTYKYTPVIGEIDKIVQDLPAGDVVILDSIGFPILTTFARMKLKQKGDALLQLIAIFGDLKNWAYKNNGIVIVTNQPESEFNKDPNHIIRPFGDKSQFAAKEIWKTTKVDSKPGITNSSIKAFRSRSVGFGTPIAQMKITNAGVEVA